MSREPLRSTVIAGHVNVFVWPEVDGSWGGWVRLSHDVSRSFSFPGMDVVKPALVAVAEDILSQLDFEHERNETSLERWNANKRYSGWTWRPITLPASPSLLAPEYLEAVWDELERGV